MSNPRLRQHLQTQLDDLLSRVDDLCSAGLLYQYGYDSFTGQPTYKQYTC